MWITQTQFEVIKTLLDFFRRHNIGYQFTGGLAGNIHGSDWPLHDIDVDVHKVDIPLLLEQFASFVTRSFGRFVDEEFDLYLATLNIQGVEVDVCQIEDAFIFSQGKRLPLLVDLTRSEQRLLFGLTVRVLPLADLISYKNLLGREADVADLSLLVKN